MTKQKKLLNYLNENDIDPNEITIAIADIFDISFVIDGWYLNTHRFN